MLRKNLMSALVAAVATGAVLTGYNAFLRSGVAESNRATARLSSYLHLDKTTQESKSDENNVVGTDNGATVSTADQTSVAVTETPSSDTAQSSSATTTSTTGSSSSTPSVDTTAMTASTEAKAESTYTVKEGDTYGCIAEKYYGSYEHYVDVMNANASGEVGFTEYALFVGAKLTLPAVSKDNLKPASTLCQ